MFFALAIIIVIGACKNKKASMQGDEEVELNDFIDAFPKTELPFSVSDTNLNVCADTNTINYTVFKKFIPDTIFTDAFKKDRKFTIKPVGRFGEINKETYLAAYVYGKTNAALYLLVLNDSNKFSAFLPLVTANKDKKVVTTATVDKKLGVNIYTEWKVEETTLYTRNIYAYNNVGTFTMVLNETNDFSKNPVKEVNPLDTFPKINKYSGDYFKGKTNILSLRDGTGPQNYKFYVHFENDNDDKCSGELRGELNLTGANTAIFRENGDPCVIDFSFAANSIKVSEQGSCGNYRGIKCFFNDTYTKKKRK